MIDTFLVHCYGCGKWYPYTSAPMIRDELWKSIADNERIKLCLDCMEERLRRKIVKADFGPYETSVCNQQWLKDHGYRTWRIIE